MSEKKVIKAEEVLKELNLEKPVNGFRKGIDKRKLITSLDDEDWLRIDNMKEAEDRKIKSEHAYKLFVLADQAVIEVERLKRSILEGLANIFERDLFQIQNTVDSEVENPDTGKPYTKSELKLLNMKLHNEAMRYLAVLRTDCSKLYPFVGSKGLDKKELLSEDEYNEIIENVVSELSETKYRLY